MNPSQSELFWAISEFVSKLFRKAFCISFDEKCQKIILKIRLISIQSKTWIRTKFSIWINLTSNWTNRIYPDWKLGLNWFRLKFDKHFVSFWWKTVKNQSELIRFNRRHEYKQSFQSESTWPRIEPIGFIRIEDLVWIDSDWNSKNVLYLIWWKRVKNQFDLMLLNRRNKSEWIRTKLSIRINPSSNWSKPNFQYE